MSTFFDWLDANPGFAVAFALVVLVACLIDIGGESPDARWRR